MISFFVNRTLDGCFAYMRRDLWASLPWEDHFDNTLTAHLKSNNNFCCWSNYINSVNKCPASFFINLRLILTIMIDWNGRFLAQLRFGYSHSLRKWEIKTSLNYFSRSIKQFFNLLNSLFELVNRTSECYQSTFCLETAFARSSEWIATLNLWAELALMSEVIFIVSHAYMKSLDIYRF